MFLQTIRLDLSWRFLTVTDLSSVDLITIIFLKGGVVNICVYSLLYVFVNIADSTGC